MSAAPPKTSKEPAAAAESPSSDSLELRRAAAARTSKLRALYRTPSHSSQLELNDVPEFANEPGPGHYFGPASMGFSALGKQKFSKSLSAPEISLPKTSWNEWSGVIVSKGHQGSSQGKETTGIKGTYDLGDSLNKRTTRFGTSQRPDMSTTLGVDPKGSPGPNINVRDVPGVSMSEEPPPKGRANKSFGKADRFSSRGGGGIGPGQYPRKDTAIGLGSGKSIGCGRAAYDKVCTPGWEEYGKCRACKGPGPPLWSDIPKEGSRAMSIGKAERFPKAKTAKGPGPGDYDQDARGVGRSKQVLSDSPTPGQAHFGYVPKMPRYRIILASTVDGAKHGSWGYH